MTRHAFWGLLVLALLFWTFGQLNGMASQRDADITASSRAALVSHPAMVRYRAKLEAAELRLVTASRTASQRADSLRLMLARGERLDTFAVFHEIAVADSEAVAACRLGILACQTRASHAEAEAVALAKQLTAQLKVGRCRVLFVPCPSRMVMFVGGAAVGAAVSGAVR
jgi:dihydroorotase-like cyclic amidohydrolase